MSYDNLSSVSHNVLKFYQQLTGEERKIPFIFDDIHLVNHSNTSFTYTSPYIGLFIYFYKNKLKNRQKMIYCYVYKKKLKEENMMYSIF